MKAKLIIIGVLCLGFYSQCFGDVYILVNKSTNEVQDISIRNDAVIETGFEKIVLPGKITDYELQYHPQYYKFKDGKFIVNIKKISDEELKKEESVQKLNKEKQDKQSAKEKLKTLGLTEDEISTFIR